MARQSISTLRPGQNVRLKFHGSKNNGNEPYEVDYTFVEFRTEGTERLAVFNQDGRDEFEAYFFQNRWRYGTSSEVVTVQEVL